MEQIMTVCKNPWCKATFYYTEEDMVLVKTEVQKKSKFEPVNQEEIKEVPKFCKKCQSFDKELSGGVSWTEKTYEGSRFDGMPHQIRYKVTNYKL